MRILHIVTWFAPGNPYGGPSRVALNQVAELRRRGHHVDLVAARPPRRASGTWRSEDHGVTGFPGVPVLPGGGFGLIAAPSLLLHVLRHRRRYDAVHVHLSRDLVTLPAAALMGRRVPFVAQTHGMIDPSTRRLAKVLDALLTRRVLRRARIVFALNDAEHHDLHAVVGDQHLAIATLHNGVPVPADLADPAEDLAPEAATGAVPEVLFCARLHPRKRPVAFARMAAALLERGVVARFSLIGADEGEGPAVNAIAATTDASTDATVRDTSGTRGRLHWDGPVDVDTVAERMARSEMLVLPAVDEPFGMVVLEALALARPVVITDQCGLAPFVIARDCGLVVPADDHPALVAAVASLLDDPTRAAAMGRRGRQAVQDEYSMTSVVDRLETAYADASIAT